MFTTLDFETTFRIVNEKKDPSPYNPQNRLVSFGIKTLKSFDYCCLYHNTCQPTPNAKQTLQRYLDEATILCCHNAKFELSWLRETGFTYDKPIYDTFLVEYVMARGLKIPLDLNSCCLRHGLEGKDDGVKAYMDANISFEDIPWDIVEKYGRQDVTQTELLAQAQIKKLGGEEEVMRILLDAREYVATND